MALFSDYLIDKGGVGDFSIPSMLWPVQLFP
jgi:hypothetical protein